MVAAGRFPIPGVGRQRRSMTYVDNLVQGVALAERHPHAPGQAFWVADQEAYELGDIVSTVRKVLAEEGYAVSGGGLRVPRMLSRVAERADRDLQRRGRYSPELHVLGELGHTIRCDISHTVDVLGYQPRVGLEEGMRRSVRWCVDHGIEPARRTRHPSGRRAAPPPSHGRRPAPDVPPRGAAPRRRS